MSRTIRRKCPDLIRRMVGNTIGAARNQRLIHWRYEDLPDEMAYAKTKARFHRDRILYCNGGVPRWFINLYYTRPRRQYDAREIARCIRADCWDDILPVDNRRMFTPHYW